MARVRSSGVDDRIEFPTPDNVACAMEAQREAGHHPLIGVAADIAKAHRRFKHAEEDHGYLCCRAREGGPIWVNRVGTFGVACAAYHFSRLAGIIGRTTIRILLQDPFFQFLFADDLQLQAGGPEKYHTVWRALPFWLISEEVCSWST